MDVKEEEILGNKVAEHWYYRAKGDATLKLLSDVPVNCIADVGAGSGYFSKLLLERGIGQEAICIDPAYECETEQTVNGRNLRFTPEPEISAADLVLMMDVLEHVDDDAALLKQYSHLLSKNGHLLVTVPAFNWLWSGHDEFLEHRRRYTRSNLSKILEKSGFDVLTSKYYYLSLLPIIVPIRVMDRLRLKLRSKPPKSSLKQHAKWINSLLTSVMVIERRLLFPFNNLAGLTVFCLAKKRIDD